MTTAARRDVATQRSLAAPRGHVRPPDRGAHFPKAWIARSVPDCFSAMLEAGHADAIALRTGARDLRGSDIDLLSRRVAQALLSRRGPAAEAVALLLDHASPVPAAMLGILRAGKFFVALDPSYPAARNRHVLQDSEAEILITDAEHRVLAESFGVRPERILLLEEIASASPGEQVPVPIGPDDLAYLLYTSGSTGEPKGVMRTHGGLLHNVLRSTETRQVCPGDRIALLFSYSFSAAIGNAFTAMLNGATLLPFDVRKQGVAPLADWLIANDITHFHTVPTVFRHLTDALEKGHAFPHLRLIQLGGESMFAKDVGRFKQHFGPTCTLMVGMGTSECGHVFDLGIDHQTECLTDVLPIGYAVDGTESFLLDRDGHSVPVGHIGEIAVRGTFVSPGYWRRPDLTAAKFRCEADGARTYLTGDLGVMLPDGCVFHLGRNDNRVRIGSQSVEIPEVEAALLALPGVNEVAVTATESLGGVPRLVAYVVPHPTAQVTAVAVRRAVSGTLPAYMVPSAYLILDALPLLPNGKVDRRALPAPTHERPAESILRLPRSPREQALASMWRDLLDLDTVSVDDSFFELGGHSLLAMRLVADIETTFGQRISLATVVHTPTIAGLARLLEPTPAPATPQAIVALQPHGNRLPFFWANGEASNALLPRYLGPGQPVYALLAQGSDGKPARHTRLEEMAAYYVEAMRIVQPTGPYLLGGFCFGAVLAFAMAQHLREQGQDVGLLALVDPIYRTSRQRAGGTGRASALEQLAGYAQRLAPLGPREKASRVGTALRIRVRRLQASVSNAGQKLACTIHLMAGLRWSIPLSWRTTYVTTLHSRAKRAYTRRMYPGPIVVLQSAAGDFDPRPAWEPFAGQGLEVRALNGEHEKIVFEEAQIRELALALKGCLERAHATLRTLPPG